MIGPRFAPSQPPGLQWCLVETLQVETLQVLLLLTAAIAIVIVIENSGRLSIPIVNVCEAAAAGSTAAAADCCGF